MKLQFDVILNKIKIFNNIRYTCSLQSTGCRYSYIRFQTNIKL